MIRTTPPRGLTLVELLSALAVSSVLLGSALPSLNDFRLRQLLQATAGSLETDVHLARATALSSQSNVRLSLQARPGGGSCTVVHSGDAHACRCDGRGQARCEGGAVLLRLSEQPASTGVSIAGPERSLLFAPGRGTVTPTGTFQIVDSAGRSVRKIVNVMGRMRTCSPDRLPGVPACG